MLIMADDKSINEIGWNLDNSYAHLPKMFYTALSPTPVPSPRLIILNNPLAANLGLDVQALHNEKGISILAGNQIPEGSVPLAQAYAGHQFAYFTLLGDGRTMLLGEQITPSGERFDIQLKGSGITPYSRRGDGRAVLGPMLREYIISEAMYALGIATTRSLAVVTTGENVMRETSLPGAVLTRVASSHLRVGTFQYAGEWGGIEDLRALADYTLERHFPYIEADDKRYLSLLQEVIKQQAVLIAKWQMVGFIHGVMNTDNMALSGETIDYGPCAFMDHYDPSTVFSSIDTHGRYAYSNQPKIGQWNLERFAETLLPLLHPEKTQAEKLAQDEVAKFAELYHSNWLAGMRAKLGIMNQESQDQALIDELLNIMYKYRADFTNTFSALALEVNDEMELRQTRDFVEWHQRWQVRLGRQPEPKRVALQVMRSTNPAIIPRNHRVESALEAAVKQGDYSVMERLLDVLSNPYAYSCEQTEYAKPPPPSNQPYRTFCGT